MSVAASASGVSLIAPAPPPWWRCSRLPKKWHSAIEKACQAAQRLEDDTKKFDDLLYVTSSRAAVLLPGSRRYCSKRICRVLVRVRARRKEARTGFAKLAQGSLMHCDLRSYRIGKPRPDGSCAGVPLERHGKPVDDLATGLPIWTARRRLEDFRHAGWVTEAVQLIDRDQWGNLITLSSVRCLTKKFFADLGIGKVWGKASAWQYKQEKIARAAASAAEHEGIDPRAFAKVLRQLGRDPAWRHRPWDEQIAEVRARLRAPAPPD